MNRSRISRNMLVAICLLTLPVLAWGQAQSRTSNGLARAGVTPHLFTPLDSTETPEALASIVPTTGKLVVTLTITVKATNLGTDVIACNVSANVFDTGSQRSFFEESAVAATGTGSTRTCVVTINYSWLLATPTLDMLSIGYFVSAPGSFVTLTNLLPFRSTSSSLPNMKVPANGATTNIAISATI